jgi:hypothetical protein
VKTSCSEKDFVLVRLLVLETAPATKRTRTKTVKKTELAAADGRSASSAALREPIVDSAGG